MPGAILPRSLATQAARSTRLPPTTLAVISWQEIDERLKALPCSRMTRDVGTIGHVEQEIAGFIDQPGMHQRRRPPYKADRPANQLRLDACRLQPARVLLQRMSVIAVNTSAGQTPRSRDRMLQGSSSRCRSAQYQVWLNDPSQVEPCNRCDLRSLRHLKRSQVSAGSGYHTWPERDG